MFLRSTTRKKDGKEHRYYSVVESVRSSPGAHPHQRTLLYLGEINSEQQAQWAKEIEVFEPESQSQQTFSLFPSDKSVPAGLIAVPKVIHHRRGSRLVSSPQPM
jgi:hypothetical protein